MEDNLPNFQFVDFHTMINIPFGGIVDTYGLVTRFGFCSGERIEEQDFIVLRQIQGDVQVQVENMKAICNRESNMTFERNETVVAIKGLKVLNTRGQLINTKIQESSILMINPRNCNILPVEMDNWLNEYDEKERENNPGRFDETDDSDLSIESDEADKI